MPVTVSASKKMRQDKKRQTVNLVLSRKLKRALSEARKSPNAKNLQKADSLIDQAAKKRFIHKNKASRLKSRLAKKLTVSS